MLKARPNDNNKIVAMSDLFCDDLELHEAISVIMIKKIHIK